MPKNGNGAYYKAKKRARVTQKRETRARNKFQKLWNKKHSAGRALKKARVASSRARTQYTRQQILRARQSRR